ncbi:MAG: 50S ribosomal protein L3 [Peptoniphilaceae bacterium]|nr:50S ribosomal protein L3 [Peptoniphilaceae bacterium]MDY6085222.1 50S ribosomal protein L3 [Peptoniphilaceae bacterium]
MKSILGKKIGMTQIFDDSGVVTPVTVVQAGPVVVTQVKTEETDGYNAVQVGYGDVREKHVTKPIKGHFRKANVALKKTLREIPTTADEHYELGQELDVTQFAAGDVIDVIGTSKGKGTQGAIRRWNYGRGPMGHGSKSHRVGGARAAGTYPARVFPGTKGSGKMGHDRVTVQNLTVVRVDAENHMILVKGAVPGPKGGLVTIREAKKAPKAKK